jgi:hypothetical protein
MPQDITDFMSRKSGPDRDCDIMQPDLDFLVARANMDMGRFVAFVGIEEGAIRSPSQNGRHPFASA